MRTLKHSFRFKPLTLAMLSIGLLACTDSSTMNTNKAESAPVAQSVELTNDDTVQHISDERIGKPVVYQVFTRLFGNTNTTNKAWGTLEENGVGKFEDFTPQALAAIKALGTSHIWYTGVPHHALVTDYTEYGISQDDPDVIKGRAGSPYAVKDYYNVNPDLAIDPARRLEEFEALIKRTHDAGMKVIIDIVPNHVARDYRSLSAPEGVVDFGENDDTSVEYAKNNNFYYVVGEGFKVPTSESYKVLGGEPHPLSDQKFDEFPAKWTGNGARAAKPDINDWYETVKVNYGVRPDGTYDFPLLPANYANQGIEQHAQFWEEKALPDSWYKFRDIAHYWLDKGVDGFRYDMAEMVPVEFWSFLNSSIKQKNPDAFLLAEVYQPDKYRDYIHKGKMDYLYDKVGFYDTLKKIMQGKGKVSELVSIHSEVSDIAPHMLHFLENHDEQRIASPDFAGTAEKGKPALAVSALISASPTLLYFGQDVGEDGSEETGFGDPTRTSIFDYVGVPAHQRFMNNGKFDGGGSSKDELALREFYEDVMAIVSSNSAIKGDFVNLHDLNLSVEGSAYSEQQFAFARINEQKGFVVVANFDESEVDNITLSIPKTLISESAPSQVLTALLRHEDVVINDSGEHFTAELTLKGLETKVFAF
ncbi:alpha-amylase family protein [Alteromonas sp. 009811495]|uniref:alpha-amylase family protein n=1 Tax=Alteromonas sp. 009811495 TaxID=3002962 RepID=UPI00237D3482|nr:alpha-amylase family protein [Alteromonas sp. 009811495]WDT84332.1 alpha-amylase family protein [Alteromonas sp. 009811495]